MHHDMQEEICEWEVTLYIEAPVALVATSSERPQLKGQTDGIPYYSRVKMKRTSFGFQIDLTSRAKDQQLAHQFALYFVGSMLDVLCLQTGIPFFVSLTEHHRIAKRFGKYPARLILEEGRLFEAFNEADRINREQPALSRALSWHRKGWYTEDPFDRFLALWNSIEVIGTKYHRKNERTRRGSKNQICDVIEQVWGSPEDKRFPISMRWNDWVDMLYDKRVDIAHGVTPVNVQEVQQVLGLLPGLQSVSSQLLHGIWRTLP